MAKQKGVLPLMAQLVRSKRSEGTWFGKFEIRMLIGTPDALLVDRHRDGNVAGVEAEKRKAKSDWKQG